MSSSFTTSNAVSSKLRSQVAFDNENWFRVTSIGFAPGPAYSFASTSTFPFSTEPTTIELSSTVGEPMDIPPFFIPNRVALEPGTICIELLPIDIRYSVFSVKVGTDSGFLTEGAGRAGGAFGEGFSGSSSFPLGGCALVSGGLDCSETAGSRAFLASAASAARP